MLTAEAPIAPARGRAWLRFLLAPLLLALGIVVLSRFAGEVSLAELEDVVRGLPPARLLAALVLTVASYAVLTGYDALGVRYVRATLPYRRIALTSFLSYAISHNLGMTLLSGGSNRYRMYTTWGLSLAQITGVAVFCSVTFWVGWLGLGTVVFIAEPFEVPLLKNFPFASLKTLGFLCAGAVLVLAAVSWLRGSRHRVLPSPRFLALQMGVAALDWCLAAGVLFVILQTVVPLSYFQVLQLFLMAQVLGMASNVPAGVGLFDATLLFALKDSVTPGELFACLLVYRVCYYLVPLAAALPLLAAQEVQRVAMARRR